MIATSLVLVAVFVPVSFFPGTTGILFRQFALTGVAFSSRHFHLNTLTLTPALSALLLGRLVDEENWFFRQVDRVINGIPGGIPATCRSLLRAFAWSL